jgi:DNA-binding NarL/FixJ family response regulator
MERRPGVKRSDQKRRTGRAGTSLASRRGDMPLRIVLADDHVIVRQALKLLLDGAGFKIVGEASNGHEAVRLVRELDPDMAVLDVVMPLLNGLDAAREIQQVSPRTKVVLLTSRRSRSGCEAAS